MYRKWFKNIHIVLIILLLFGITFGYAILNSTLNINGKSTIQKNTWDVHFENIKVVEGSATATVDPVISNNTSISNFEITLDKPGDFYAFTVDVVNDGSIDAMIDSVEKIPDLTTAQQKYLNYIIEYQNGEQISTKQLVKASEFVRLKVIVEYKKDIIASDLPQNAETLNLGFTVNYVQSDGIGSSVPGKSLIKIVSGDGTQTGDEVCIREECFYVISSTDDTVTMLAKYNLYVGGEYNSEWIAYGDEATGKQDQNMLGYVSEQNVRRGTTKFSSTNYWYSNGLKVEYGARYPAYVYDSNSTLYNYVENYKTYLSTLEITPSEARLITYEELTALGCSDNSCSKTPSWVYSTSYWSGSASSSLELWKVYSNGDFIDFGSYHFSDYFGCRPVITISRSLI